MILSIGRVKFPAARRYIPVLLLCLLLSLAGIGIYRKAHQAVAPPMYDAIEYYMKAGNVWAALKSGHSFNLMKVVPTFRPPGTVLFLYPLGFKPEFQGMLFRVVFVPLVLFILAFWIVANPLAPDGRGRWLNFGAAAALASLPLFYQFEYNEQLPSAVWWGLMDTPVASLSALALAFMLASVNKRGIGLAICGGGLAAFTLLVKPVGFFLIPLVLWHWMVEVVVACWPLNAAWRDDRRFRRYIAVTLPVLAVMICTVVMVATRSAYVSPENLHFFSYALKYMRSIPMGDVIQGLRAEIPSATGLHGVVLFVIFALCIPGRAIWRAFRGGLTRNDVRFCAALFAFFCGVAWLFLLPGPLCRFMFPYILVFLIAVTPRLVAGMRELPPAVRGVSVGAGTAWFCITLALLFMNHPPVPIQKWLGLNLTSGGFRGETALAGFVCDEAAREGRRLLVYSTGIGCVPGVVQAAVIQRSYQNPRAKGVDVLMPMDWNTGPVYIRERLVAADYIMFHPAGDAAGVQKRFATTPPGDFEMERELLEAWMTTAGASEGVEQMPVDGGTLRLARITDRGKFDGAYGDFVGRYQWRAYFMKANAERHFFTSEELTRMLPATRVNARPVRFGGQFILHAVDFQRKENGLLLRLVWESTAVQELDREVAVHLVDDNGKILAQANYAQSVVGGRAGAGDAWVDEIDLPAEKLAGATRVGLVLAHHPGPELLPPDNGLTDWDGRRLLIPLPALGKP